ncbi:MAG: substrate-binding domain-containing protein [Planctomycetota bacterium]|nr:substrate-binding domain-containing protein [Planctomycetota bacterium]
MSQTTAPAPALSSRPGGIQNLLEPQQWILVGLLIAEAIIFSILGTNFFSIENFFSVPRLNTELGLIALAMTPVIVTGGIDLSVGSMMGLAIVIFGSLWHNAHFTILEAGAVTLCVGAIGGGLNALLITRLNIPPLIVTLGTYSLYRGLAVGMTRGAENFTGFPDGFLSLGNGHFFSSPASHFSGIPNQLPILIVVAFGFWLLLHRSAIGRGLVAVGYSPQGAEHAGIPVKRRVGTVYILSGLCAALAAIIYAARLGQAKADAGSGYELTAITAVVLGGTSIFGGRGSIVGTLLGLFAIALLENGIRLADMPGELAGILKGILLLLAIGADWRPTAGASIKAITDNNEELNMRNSQLTVLSIVILAAALIVAGGNYLMLQSVSRQGNTQMGMVNPSPRTGMQPATGVPPETTKQIAVAMMPKSKGNAYFIACQKGAEDAAKDLGVKLLWDGPTDPDPARQNEIVDTWITRGVDVIAVSVENRGGLSTALRAARAKGIKVVTWDADADPDARDFFVNQATPQGIGSTLMDDTATAMGGKGSFAIITSSLTAANQNEWIKYAKERLAEKYPDIKLIDIEPCEDKQPEAFNRTQAILNAHPEVTAIMAVCSPGVPGAAEAVTQSGRKDVKVVGLGLPNENKQYVHSGVTQDVILWNTMDLGYLAVQASTALVKGTLKQGDTSFQAGRIGKVEIKGDNILLGQPYSFTKDNIDQFDF